MEEEKGGRIGQRPYILKIITERNYIIIIDMKKAKILLFVTALVAVLTSCGVVRRDSQRVMSIQSLRLGHQMHS